MSKFRKPRSMVHSQLVYRIGMLTMSCLEYAAFAAFIYACFKLWAYLPK